MNTDELLFLLRAQITPAERNALRDNTVAHISRYNRDTLLRMLDMEEPAPALVDTGRAKALHAALREYLDRYMPEAPEVHKWIILACLFLTLVARKPMHPKAILGWKKAGGDYICPAREEGGVCQFCVCQ